MDKSKLRETLLETEKQKPEFEQIRYETCYFVSKSFKQFGEVLQLSGYLIGDDRVSGASPFGFGSDEVSGVSLLLRIAAELTASSAGLFQKEQAYAAAALLRQLVEVEYLAWAFETRHRDAETWLRSTKPERFNLFTPAKLRKAADGRFRGKDYSYHCEMGGHPTPEAMKLLTNDTLVVQLLISDLVGHMDGIWGHFVRWGQQQSVLKPLFKEYEELGLATGKHLQLWRESDTLISLGPPP